MSNGGAPARAPIALVAPGTSGYNLLCGPGIAGMILGDFERNGTVNHTDPEYLARVIRPGAILLANLDIDDLARVPSSPPADMLTLLDNADAVVNGANDERDLTLIKLRKPDPCSVTASSVVLRVHARDARRIRIFQVGAGAAPILGAGKPAGPAHEANIAAPPPPASWAFDYRVEALTLPGDPRAAFAPPTGATPNRPRPYPATLPSGSSGSPVYANRSPADVWIEVVHKNAGGADVAIPRDVAVLTIAPFMLLSNLHTLRRAFVVALDTNHEFVYDLAEGLNAALGGVTLPANTSTRFTPHRPPYDPARTPASTPGNLYIIDGARFPDHWIQDEIEVGYCWGPHAWMHVVLHCKRNRELADFVHGEMVGPSVGVFDGLHGGELDGQDYGGNLEVSPPVTVATPALGRNAAGPSVRAHRPAPFGKMIFGDCTPRPAHAEFRNFLIAQKAQPVLPIDTSWLAVGHVDEILSFVRSNQGRRFRLLLASVRAMNALLEEAVRIPVADGRTNFHRGKYKSFDRIPPARTRYDEHSIEQYLHGPVRTYSDRLRTDKLAPIQRRLEQGLDIRPSEIIPFPTYFETPVNASAPYGSRANQTVAETVGSVNMLVANDHLMIPRPFGPRLPAVHCTTVLRAALDRLGMNGVSVRMPPDTGYWFWAFPGESLSRLASYFIHTADPADRVAIIHNIRTGAALPAGIALLVAAMQALILAHPNNTAAPALSTVLSGDAFTRWRRVWIPEPRVDLIEAYMLSVLEPHGLTVHFVDDFHCYHAGSGEAHCGTNVIREPPELSAPERWWDAWDPDYDVAYDPAS